MLRTKYSSRAAGQALHNRGQKHCKCCISTTINIGSLRVAGCLFHTSLEVLFTSPCCSCTADCYAIAASEEVVYVWQFRNSFTRQLASETVAAAATGGGTTGSSAAAKLQREGRERMFHIDNAGDCQAPEQFKSTQIGSSADPICAITAHQHQLLVARSSGVVHGFGLPGLNLDGQYLLRCRPQRLALNCDGSKLAVVDFNGVFSFMEMTAAGNGKIRGEHMAYERKVRTWISSDICTGVLAAGPVTAAGAYRGAAALRLCFDTHLNKLCKLLSQLACKVCCCVCTSRMFGMCAGHLTTLSCWLSWRRAVCMCSGAWTQKNQSTAVQAWLLSAACRCGSQAFWCQGGWAGLEDRLCQLNNDLHVSLLLVNIGSHIGIACLSLSLLHLHYVIMLYP